MKNKFQPGEEVFFSTFGEILDIHKGIIIRETAKSCVMNTAYGETRRMKKRVFSSETEAIIDSIKILNSSLQFDYKTSCLEIYRTIAKLLETNPEEFL